MSMRPLTALALCALFWGGAVLAGGCTPEAEEAPLTMTTSDSLLVNVLVGLHEADSKLFEAAVEVATGAQGDGEQDDPGNVDGAQERLPDFSNGSLRDSVLSVFGLSEEAFNQMIAAQLNEPERLLLIYNKVLEQSSAR